MRTQKAQTDADNAETANGAETVGGTADDARRRLTNRILRAFHNAFGVVRFGLPEQICANALAVELQVLGLRVQREVPIEVVHRGVSMGLFRIDMIVEGEVVLEIKSAETIRSCDEMQLLNYLRVSRYELGFVLLFGVKPRFRRLAYSNTLRRL